MRLIVQTFVMLRIIIVTGYNKKKERKSNILNYYYRVIINVIFINDESGALLMSLNALKVQVLTLRYT